MFKGVTSGPWFVEDYGQVRVVEEGVLWVVEISRGPHHPTMELHLPTSAAVLRSGPILQIDKKQLRKLVQTRLKRCVSL
jgi:hypothetical protein